MDKNVFFALIQIAELVVFVVILSRTKSSILSRIKGNFEAILQFIGQDSFFETLDKALKKAEESLDENDQAQRDLIAEIALAQSKLNTLRDSRVSIENTVQSIKDLQ